jgi:ribosomal protein L6P/L9E
MTITGIPYSNGFPDATNTGVPAGVALTASNGLTLSTPGQVVSGLNISGTVYITASNVTLENCDINFGGYFGIELAAGVTGVTIQNCEINGQGLNGSAGSSGIQILQGASATISGNNIYGAANGISISYPLPGGITIEGNYIHDLLAPSATNHYNGIQFNGSSGVATGPLLIQGNTILNTQGQTDAVMIDNYWGPVSNVTINHNLLSGGDFTVYVDGHFNSSPMTNVSVTNNVMGVGTYGYTDFNQTNPTFHGNIDDITGSSLPGQSSSNTAPPSAPVITAFSPDTNGVDTTSSIKLSGTAEAGSTVTVLDGTTAVGSAPVNTSGDWTLPETNAANGVHTFTATDTDANGTSTASAPFSVTVNASSPPPPPVNLVVNGGFETGDFTGWTIGSYEPDQTIITTNSEAGTYAAALGPAGADGSLSQIIPTTAGQQYTLTFWLANMSSGPDDFTAKWNGNAVLALVSAPAQGYTEYTFTVTATGSTSNLEFDYRQDPTQWRLDGVSVTPVGTQGTTPTVAVSINNTDVDVANGTGTVTFAFGAAPATFVLADTSAVGGTLSNLQKTDATHYTATFTPAANTDIANASVSVTAGSWQSNGTAGAGGSTPTFTVDTVTPTVAVSINNTDVNVANGTGTVTFAFSEAPVAFTLADTSAVGGTLSNLQKTDATHYTATFTGAANTNISNASVSVTAGSWQEGNGNAGAGGSTAAFTVNTLTPDLDGPEAPVLTIKSHALTVNAGGSMSLPIGVTAVDSDDTISVRITGLTRYETITDNLDHKVFSGRSVTLTAAEVNSGLTLSSTYGGSGHPVNTLTVTASNSTSGETGTSAAQTIKVTDPPAGSTSSDSTPTLGAPPAWGGNAGPLAALLTQYAAAGFQSESKSGFGGGVITTTPNSDSPFDHNDPVLTKPMH